MEASRTRRVTATGPSWVIVWPVVLGLVVLLTGASGSCSEAAPCAAMVSVVAEDADRVRAPVPGERDNGRGESTGEQEAVRAQTVVRAERIALVRVPVSLDPRPHPSGSTRPLAAVPARPTGARLLVELNVSRT